MKKLFFFLCCLLALSATTFAEKSEWIDPGYDFTKAKSICVDYAAAPEIADGVRDKDAQAVFLSGPKRILSINLSKQNITSGSRTKPKGTQQAKKRQTQKLWQRSLPRIRGSLPAIMI